jgi:preprotein translocase subunit YajC
MEYGWILAQADQNTQVIKAEDISGSAAPEATTTQADPKSAVPPPRNSIKAQWSQIVFIVLLFVLMYFMMFRGPKKRQQQQQQMVQSLKKNDKVQTIGGILGTVLEVNENEITIKIDESNNTKMKVLPSSISKVIG